MKTIADYNDPFEAVEEFETALAEYTGARGVIVTDSCTHAIELALRYRPPHIYASIPKQTYISVLMTLAKLDIDYMFTDTQWETNYRIEGTNVWDYARHFERDMFVPGQIQCLSFGYGKTLDIGHGGAILTDDRAAYEWMKKAAYDGRDMKAHKHWGDQKEYDLGFHYHMRPEDAVIGLNKLAAGQLNEINKDGYKNYADLSGIKLNKSVTQR